MAILIVAALVAAMGYLGNSIERKLNRIIELLERSARP